MRFRVPALAGLLVLALAACSRPAPPPGRWEGTYDSGGTMVAARVEIAPGGAVRLSAPDLAGTSDARPEEHLAMRARLAATLIDGWDDVTARPLDFDGTTFRKPGGIAPQMVWDKATNQMTLILYLGTAPEIHVPLRPVSDFSESPWPSG